MPQYKHDYKQRYYNIDYKPGETDLQYYRRLAKAADQRLLRLERLSEQKGYEAVTKYAYDRAMRDLEIYGGGKRFNTKPPLNKDGTVDNRLLSEKLADMRTFLSSVTSTKQGIQSVYEERAKTLNKEFDTNYTWQDLADLYHSGDAEKALRYATSDLMQKSIGIIQHAKERLKEETKNNRKITVSNKNKLEFDKALELVQNKALNKSVLKGLSKRDRARLEEIINEMKEENTD